MGIFDSVNVECPKCRRMIEFQSKAVELPGLDNFTLELVPSIIAEDLDGKTERCKCGNIIKLKCIEIKTKRLIIDEEGL